MKKYKHKLTGDIAGYNGSRYLVAELGSLYVPDRYIENSNDWDLITNIEVGKVYKSIKSLVIILIKEVVDEHDVKAIGFDGFGNWCAGYFGTTNLIETTKEEWFERLKEEAIKRGLVEGVKFKSCYIRNEFIINDYRLSNDLSLVESTIGHLMDSDTGKWATVIEEKKPILTTHDGVVLFDKKDKIFIISRKFELLDDLVSNIGFYSSTLYFSTKEKAQEYIDLNQKKYSLADLKDALNNLK